MRKTILLFAFVAITAISFGQKTDSLAQKIDSIDCSRVTKTVDEFSGEITYEARITDDVNFLKIKKSGVIKYYLSIWIKETGIYTGTGVNIILKNGKKIKK